MVCTSSGTNDRRCRASTSSLVSWLENWSLTFCAWCVLEFDHQITFTMQKLIRLLNSIRSGISTKSPLFMSRLTATLFWVQFSEKGAHPQFLVRLSSEHITIVCVMRWWIVIRNEWVGTLHCTVTNTHSDYTMEFQKSSDRPSNRPSDHPNEKWKHITQMKKSGKGHNASKTTKHRAISSSVISRPESSSSPTHIIVDQKWWSRTFFPV